MRKKLEEFQVDVLTECMFKKKYNKDENTFNVGKFPFMKIMYFTVFRF